MDPKFVVELSGRSYPLYSGVLSEAHERGLQSITTEIVQIPTADNEQTAIVKATVTLKDGQIFTDFGDASPKNVKGPMVNALLRFASTRAKGRALRDAINCGQTLLEELGDLEDAHPRNGGHQTPHQAHRERAAAPAAPGAPGPAPATPGYEETYSQPGTRHYTRAELIEGTRKRLEQAKTLGIAVPDHKPELMANKALFQLAEKLSEEIKAAKAAAQMAAQADAMAAEVS